VVFGEQVRSDGDIWDGATWRKSSWSAVNGNCVEVAGPRDGLIAVRDSKDAGYGPVLMLKAESWQSFLDGVKKTSLP
jgi:hypothetical protein